MDLMDPLLGQPVQPKLYSLSGVLRDVYGLDMVSGSSTFIADSDLAGVFRVTLTDGTTAVAAIVRQTTAVDDQLLHRLTTLLNGGWQPLPDHEGNLIHLRRRRPIIVWTVAS